MRKKIQNIGWVCLLIMLVCPGVFAQSGKSEYVVLVRESTQADADWKKVVDKLVQMHQAEVVPYGELPSEALPRLRELYPRYVAVVDKPGNVTRDFVIDINQMSRKIDKDMFADFLWGIITGYDADAAMRLVERAETPKVVSNAWCNALEDFKGGKYFERMGLCTEEDWEEKNSLVSPPTEMKVTAKSIYWGEHNNPDIVLWGQAGDWNELAVRHNERKMHFVTRDGKLVMGDQELKMQDNSRVFVLSMMFGNPQGERGSFPIAWMNSQGVGAVVTGMTFSNFDKGTLGTLQFWLTDAGRFSLAEAQFLNQQEILYRLNELDPENLDKPYPYGKYSQVSSILDYNLGLDPCRHKELAGATNVVAAFCLWYERDLMVYYGDPAWNVRAKDTRGDQPYTVSCKLKGNKYVVTIKTSENFTWDRLGGDLFKRVGKLPVCYFFPERLKNPRLGKQKDDTFKVVVDENFLLVYDAFFKPNMKYQIEIEVDG